MIALFLVCAGTGKPYKTGEKRNIAKRKATEEKRSDYCSNCSDLSVVVQIHYGRLVIRIQATKSVSILRLDHSRGPVFLLKKLIYNSSNGTKSLNQRMH